MTTKNYAPSTIRAKVRNVLILTDFLTSGIIRKRIVHLVEYPLSGEIGKVAEAFLNKMKSARRSELTINEHRRMLSYFIEGLSLKSKNKLTEITESDIIDFIDSEEVKQIEASIDQASSVGKRDYAICITSSLHYPFWN